MLTIADDPARGNTARCISLSFSSDPLIQWCQSTGAQPWAQLSPETQRWQEHRVATAVMNGRVLCALPSGVQNTQENRECLGVAIFYPPKQSGFSGRFDFGKYWQYTTLFLQRFGLPPVRKLFNEEVGCTLSPFVARLVLVLQKLSARY